MRSEKLARETWYVQVIDIIEAGWKRHHLSGDMLLRRMGIMIQVSNTIDEVIYIDQNFQRIDPVGYRDNDAWKELVNRRVNAIEAAAGVRS